MRKTFATFLLVLLAAAPARAQQGQDDPALPDIAPQEVEIRGELEFSFPRLERQPLIGFNPPPRVPEVPETRRPYVEPYKQRAAELPGGDASLPLAEGRASQIHRVTDVVLEAGGGRFLSRYLDAGVLVPVGPSERLRVDLSYTGTDGQDVTYDGSAVPMDSVAASANDRLEGELALVSERGDLTTTLTTGGLYRSYTLYGAAADSANQRVRSFPSREKRTGFGAISTTWTRDALLITGDLSYRSTVVETPVLTLGTTPRGVAENTVQGGFDIAYEAAATTLALMGSLAGAGLNDNRVFEGDNRYGSVGATAAFPFLQRGSFLVGAHLLAFRSSEATGISREGTYFSPEVEIDIFPLGGVHLFARQKPGVEANQLADIFETNPYLGVDRDSDAPAIVRVQPTIRHVDARAGARLYGSRTRVSAYADWEERANDLFFTEADTASAIGGFPSGFFQTSYGDTRTVSLGAEGTLFVTDRLQAAASLVARRARLVDEDVAVPYTAPLTGRIVVSYALADARGLVRVGTTVRAPAYVDLQEDERTELAADLDAYGRYRVAGRFSVVARLRNALPGLNEWWQGYPQPPLVAQIGFRLDW